MSYKILAILIFLLVVVSGCVQNKPIQPTLRINNGTLISTNTAINLEGEKNHIVLIEYSSDEALWKEISKKNLTENKNTFLFETKSLEEGEYFLRATDLENNLTDTKTISISKPPYFDLEHKLTLENKTLFIEAYPVNISGKIKSYLWKINNQSYDLEKIKTPYNGENLTISLLAANNYKLNHNSKIDIHSNILDKLDYCIVKSLELNTEGKAKHEYKTVTFDFNNTKVFVNPILKSKPRIGKTIETEDGYIALAYGLEVVGTYYGNLSKCSTGQLVKGTRTFGEYTTNEEWYDNNYPQKPGPSAPCSQQGTKFCNDDYSIHAQEKSSVIEYDNKTVHWYDIPNIMLPDGFLPAVVNQTFISHIKGDNGYCWIKWDLFGEYEKSVVEKTPLNISIVDRQCFVDSLPV